VHKSAGKVLTLIFWDQDGILLIDYLPEGHTINPEHYSFVLVQMKDILKENGLGSSPSVSCSCTTIAPTHRTNATQKNWPTWASSVLTLTLFSGSGPVGLPLVP